jgi:hypothetical protein
MMCSPSPAPARLSLVTMSPSFLIDSTCGAREIQNKKAREIQIKKPGKVKQKSPRNSNKKAREIQLKNKKPRK